jgi:hypothetical protein
MSPLFDLARVVENCQFVAHHALQEGPLKQRFARGCQALLRTPLKIDPAMPVLTFGRDEWCEFLTRRNVIPASHRSSAKFIPEILVNHVRCDYAAMRTLFSDISPTAIFLLDLVISEIGVFQLDQPEAGSHSASIGFLWINPKSNWSAVYFAEIVFHELLHNILFLEDLTRGVMPDMELLEREDTRAYSAVRKTLRYFDSAFHASYVAAGMLCFHQRLAELGQPGQIEKIADLLKHGRLGVADLKRVALRQADAGRPILTPNGEELLKAMFEFFDTPDNLAIDNLLAA